MFRNIFLRLLFLTPLIFSLQNATAQFVMDMSRKEFRAKNDIIILDDLTVGEIGNIPTISRLCRKGDNLFISKNITVGGKKSDIFLNIQAKREPNNLISLVISDKQNPKKTMDSYLFDLSLSTLGECFTDDVYFKIKSINGATKLTDLFNVELH